MALAVAESVHGSEAQPYRPEVCASTTPRLHSGIDVCARTQLAGVNWYERMFTCGAGALLNMNLAYVMAAANSAFALSSTYDTVDGNWD